MLKKIVIPQCLFLLFSLLLFDLWGCSSTNEAPNDEKDSSLPYTIIKSFKPDKIKEPSGITFHDQRQTLYIVGDQGNIGEFTLEGELLNHRNIEHYDFEGITCHPVSGLLYLVIEGQSKILQVEPVKFRVQRVFTIDWHFNNQLIVDPADETLESITCVPDSEDQNNCTFFIANKNAQVERFNRQSIICEISLPPEGTNEESLTATIIRTFAVLVPTITDLHFESKSRRLFILSDIENQMIELDAQGTIKQRYQLPGVQQEGISFAEGHGYYMTDDQDAVYQIQY